MENREMLARLKSQSQLSSSGVNGLKSSSLTKSQSLLPPTASGQTRLGKIKDALEKGEDLNGTLNLKNLQSSSNTHQKDEIDLECERLKESYTQIRKRQRSHELNKSANRNQSRSIGRSKLFDSTLDATQGCDKENAADGDLIRASSGSNPLNKYKRARPENTFSNYQEKYNKLEENFKRFTQGLQEKRNSSANGRSAMAVTGTNQLNNSFGPIRSELSPTRQTKNNQMMQMYSSTNNNQLGFSRSINPLGMSTTLNNTNFAGPQNPNGSLLLGQAPAFVSGGGMDKSLAIESLLGHPGFQNEKQNISQQPSILLSMELKRKDGCTRLQMLQSLVTRINLFMENSFSNLITLCVSKNQEAQIQDLQTQLDQAIQQANYAVSKLNDEDQSQIQDECQRLQEIYQQIAESLSNCFREIVNRIYSVDSETFKTHKFKDTLSALEHLITESHRLNLYQILPTLIESMKLNRIQAACGLLQAQIYKRKSLRLKKCFNLWKSQAGLHTYITKTFRQANLTRIMCRLIDNWNIKGMSRYLYKWRQLAINDKMQLQANVSNNSFLEDILINSHKFNMCLQDDQLLSQTLRERVLNYLGFQSDFLFLSKEAMKKKNENGEEFVQNIDVLIGFDSDKGFPRQVNLQNIKGSLTEQCLDRNIKKLGKGINISSLFSHSDFNDLIDTPLTSKSFLNEKSSQNLNALIIPLLGEELIIKGVFRVFTSQKISEDIQAALEETAQKIGLFIERIQNLRNHLGQLQFELDEKNEQLEIHNLESSVHHCLFEIIASIQEGSKQDFSNLIKIKSDIMLGKLIPGCKLRQIYHKVRDTRDQFAIQKITHVPILEENNEFEQQALIRQRDHRNEKQQMLEDFLDYQKDVITHQISVDQDCFNFIFHRDVPKNAYTQVKETLSENMRFAITLFANCLRPVLQQGFKIHEELAEKLKNQQRELVRQVSLNTTAENLRNKLSGILDYPEQEAYDICVDAIKEAILQSDLTQNVRLENFALLLNAGILTGEPLVTSQVFAYLTKQQNQSLLQMPMSLDSNCQEMERIRYQANAEEYAGERHEIKIKEKRYIQATLMICSNKSLLGLAKLQMTISEMCPDPDLVGSDIKALLISVQHEASKAFQQIVYAQSSQNYQFKSCFDQLQQQVSSLQIDLDFFQAMQQNLVLPFTQAPSAKLLGLALTQLASKVLPQLILQAISLVLDNQVVVYDIRLLDWKFNQIEMLDKKFLEDTQKPVVTFNIHEKTIQLNLLGDNERRSLLLRLSLPPDVIAEAREETFDFLINQCEIFQAIVTPFVQSAMSSLSMTSLMPTKQEQLPRVLTKIFMQRKYGYIYNFFMRLKELQVNKVPIFTRLVSYGHILRTRYHTFGIDEQIGYQDDHKRELLCRAHILQLYAKSFQNLNTLGLKVKQSYFVQWKHEVLVQMQQEQNMLEYEATYQPTREQRLSIGLIYKHARILTKRAYFAKLAVLTSQFSRLNNPHNKELAAALCVFVNYKRIRQRFALQKLRSNASVLYYRNFAGAELKDRDQMLNYNRLLLHTNLNTMDASANLEMALGAVLEKSLSYLQESMGHETLDLIVVSIQQSNGRKARGFVFNNKIYKDFKQGGSRIQRIEENQIIDGVMNANINMFLENFDNLQDFNLSFRRDIILCQMIKHQEGKAVNPGSAFAGQNVDRDMAQRMMIIKKSKSALIVPLLSPTKLLEEEEIPDPDFAPELNLVGSLEFYKFHFQPFDEELERRICTFAKILSHDVLPVYFSLRQTQIQIDSLRTQISRNTRAQTSLSSLLRQVYFNGPTQLNAAQILPIIIEPSTRTAYFFQFKDNHIYNFTYEQTFIGEIVDMACILELASNQPNQNNESQKNQEQNMDDATTNRSFSYFSNYPQQLGDDGHPSMTTSNHQRRNLDAVQIRSITNEKFLHIMYYPILAGPLKKTRAILEVCYNSESQIPRNVLTVQIQNFMETFSAQLGSLEQRLKTFCKFTESAIVKKDSIKKSRYFLRWKTMLQFEVQQRHFVTNQKQAINQTEQCFSEYVKNLESYDGELKRLTEQRDELTENLNAVNLDRTAKYKFLGAALMIVANMQRAERRTKLQNAMKTWKYNNSVTKIAEKAFNKILELNHKHSIQRFRAACLLIEKSIGKTIKRDALESIQKFAMMSHLKYHRSKTGMSFRTSQDNSVMLGDAFSRKSFVGDNLSNILRPGLMKTDLTSTFNGQDPPSVSGVDKKKFSAGTSYFTPGGNTNRTYDSQMVQYGFQMGFGAVPPRVQQEQKKKRSSKSRSTSKNRTAISK